MCNICTLKTYKTLLRKIKELNNGSLGRVNESETWVELKCEIFPNDLQSQSNTNQIPFSCCW